MRKIDDIKKQIEKIQKYSNSVPFPAQLCLRATEVLNNMLHELLSTDSSQLSPQSITKLYNAIEPILKLFKELNAKNWAKSNFDTPVDAQMNKLRQSMEEISNICTNLGLNLTKVYDPSSDLIIEDYQSLIGIYVKPSLSKDTRQPKKIDDIEDQITALRERQIQSQSKPTTENQQLSKPQIEETSLSNIKKYKISKSDYKKEDEHYNNIYPEIFFYRGKMNATQEPITVMTMGEDQERFQRTVELLTAMKHPGLETFIGSAVSPLPYEIVTSRKGEELSTVIQRRSTDDDDDELTLQPGDRTMIAFKIAKAAAFLHSRNIIHRDLTTSNILIEKNKNPKIINFANSRYMPENKGDLSAFFPCTSQFRAPELFQKENYDETVDVFAFSGILFELLHGSPPFSSGLGASRSIQNIIVTNQRPAIRKCSPDLKALIQSCWDQDPSKRPSFADIVDQMLSKRIAFPTDEESDELIQFYDSNSVKNTTVNTCLDLFKAVFEAINEAYVYERELIRIRSILHSYYFLLQTNTLTKEEVLVESNLSIIRNALEDLLSIIQNTKKDRWGSIALMIPSPQFSTLFHNKMDDIFVAMTELGFNDLPRFSFIPCDILSDFRLIYSIFNDYIDKYTEAKERMEEIQAFLAELNLTVEPTAIEVNDIIQKCLNHFKNYEKPRNHYKPVKELGKGLTSTVYLAKDLSRNNAQVAIKEFNKRYLVDEEALLRLKREITFLVTLNHQYLVSFIGFNADPGKPFWVISEYVTNGDLFNANYKNKLTGFQKTKIMFEIAEGMEYLHERHIIHRDLKTANILLNKDTPKITDFGYAKANLSLENTTRVGTINYMAPEVLYTKNYSYAADVCSYARMLWELYDGRYPWSWINPKNSKNYITQLQEIIKSGSQPLPFNKPLSDELRSLIESGYQLDPCQRPSFTDILNRMIREKIAFPDSDPILIDQFYAEKARIRESK